MLANIGADELAEWMAYEKVAGPLGGARGDFHAALIASTLLNVNRGKNDAVVNISDCMPNWDPRPQTDDEMEAIARQLNKALGGTEG